MSTDLALVHPTSRPWETGLLFLRWPRPGPNPVWGSHRLRGRGLSSRIKRLVAAPAVFDGRRSHDDPKLLLPRWDPEDTGTSTIGQTGNVDLSTGTPGPIVLETVTF